MGDNDKIERTARLFHETYEELAPRFGYRTREESAVEWEDVPEDNRKLMYATVELVLLNIEASMRWDLGIPPETTRENPQPIITYANARNLVRNKQMMVTMGDPERQAFNRGIDAALEALADPPATS